MPYDCKNCQHKLDGDCPCTVPGTCDFTEKKEKEGENMVTINSDIEKIAEIHAKNCICTGIMHNKGEILEAIKEAIESLKINDDMAKTIVNKIREPSYEKEYPYKLSFINACVLIKTMDVNI